MCLFYLADIVSVPPNYEKLQKRNQFGPVCDMIEGGRMISVSVYHVYVSSHGHTTEHLNERNRFKY